MTSARTKSLRAFALALLLALIAVPSATSAVGSATQDAPPATNPLRDVVLVVLEGVTDEALERVATPTLDRFAGGALRFTSGLSDPSPTPTLFALHFGAYGSRETIGGPLNGSATCRGVPPRRIALAQSLAAYGYRTALFGLWGLSGGGDGNPLESARRFGFQSWRAGTAYESIGSSPDDPQARLRVDDGETAQFTEAPDGAITRAFTDYWRSTDPARPRFACVAFVGSRAVGSTPGRRASEGSDDLASGAALDDAQLTAYDALLGRILAAVDLSRTYVVVLSTAAAGTSGPPRRDMPLFVAGPGIVAGTTTSIVHAVDVPVTLLALLGVATPAGAYEDGANLAPALVGEPAPRGPVLCRAFAPAGNGPYASEVWSVVDPSGLELCRTAAGEQLFAFEGDPDQRTELPTDDARAAALRAFKSKIAP